MPTSPRNDALAPLESLAQMLAPHDIDAVRERSVLREPGDGALGKSRRQRREVATPEASARSLGHLGKTQLEIAPNDEAFIGREEVQQRACEFVEAQAERERQRSRKTHPRPRAQTAARRD